MAFHRDIKLLKNTINLFLCGGLLFSLEEIPKSHVLGVQTCDETCFLFKIRSTKLQNLRYSYHGANKFKHLQVERINQIF